VRILLIAIVVLLFAPLSHVWAGGPPKKLNVVFITADDMNADSSGWMGSKLGATPNLDKFAGTAHRFVNNHVTAPICQPSRSAFMTGKVPHRNGALGFNPIKSGTPTLVSILRGAGWYTAVIDKFPHMKPDAEFPWHLKLAGSGKNPKLFAEHVLECIKAAKDAGKPLFLNANITDPHRPFAYSAQGKKKNPKKAEGVVKPYDPKEIVVPSFLEDIPDVRREVAEYYTSVRRFDMTFGELMAVLRSVGLEENTIFIFLSDHGMSFPFSKATVYRNGTWSPVLVRWPGMDQPQTREEYVSSVDILPTLLELLGEPARTDIDGRSWMPLLRGQKQANRDYVITHVNTVSSGKSFSQRCVRSRDFSYMFHAWPNGTQQFRVEAMSGLSYQAMAKAAESDARIKSRVQQLVVGTAEQFFDLRADPDERVNLMADSKHKAEINRLRGLLLAHMEKTNDPQFDSFRKVMQRK
jgi:N-sulfoglucosamine sulfohydrolase